MSPDASSFGKTIRTYAVIGRNTKIHELNDVLIFLYDTVMTQFIFACVCAVTMTELLCLNIFKTES